MKLEQNEKVILSVYRNRNFTKAAAELGISQPALSAAINKIENDIGIRIFDRKITPISPTEEGMVYIEYLKKFRYDYQECMKKINDIIDGRNRTICIGAPEAYANAYLPDVIQEFNSRFPECIIKVKVATLQELVEMALEGRIDCFISTSGEPEPTFVTEAIEHEKLYLCVPKSWKVNEGMEKYAMNLSVSDNSRKEQTGDLPKENTDWTVFSGLKLISLEKYQPLKKIIDEFLLSNNIQTDDRITVNQVLLGVNLAAQGVGMTFASEAAIKGCSNIEGLCIYPLPEAASKREIYIAYNANSYISKMCRAFMDMLKNSPKNNSKNDSRND